jgi:hypothetical protein
LPCEQVKHLNSILNGQLWVSGQESEEVVVEGLELESVLDLVRFDEGIDYQAHWDRFDLFE